MKTNFIPILLFGAFFCNFSNILFGQTSPLFTASYNNPCIPSEVRLSNIVNDAASYNWDFGNGQTSSDPALESVVFDTPGNHSINLDITTHPGQRLLKNVRVLEAIDHEFIGPVDFYTAIYDESDNFIYRSITTHQNPQVDIPHSALLNNGIYHLDLWDFELIGADDFCGSFFFNSALDNQTVTIEIEGIPVALELTIEDAAANYSYAFDLALEQPFITAQNNQLRANAPLSQTSSHNRFTWYINEVEIEDSDSQTITATSPGTYTVHVNVVSGCRGLSTPFDYGLVGSEEVEALNDFSVYPNPFKEEIWIDLEAGEDFSFALSNVAGRKIDVFWELVGQQVHINTYSLPKGIYFLQVRSQDEKSIHTFPLIKN